MASMFDQYNDTLIREGKNQNINNGPPPSSGYVSIKIKNDTPIFTKQKMNLNLPYKMTHLCVSNDWFVVLMANYMIFRLNLKQPEKNNEVFIEKYMGGLKVSKVFLDPLGCHYLIALSPKSPGFSAELLYLNRNSNKPKYISKFKDQEITAVAFNHNNTSETNTGPILLGTSKGLIFEADIGIDGDKIFQNNWKQLPNYLPLYGGKELDGLVFDIGRPITGIDYHKPQNSANCLILVTTLDRLYKFQENIKVEEKQPFLQAVFNAYLNVPEQLKDFHEINNKLNYSKLCISYENQYPKSFGWLTEPGIFYSEFDSSAEVPSCIISNQIIPYPELDEAILSAAVTNEYYNKSKQDTNTNIPISFILSEFHALLLFFDHISAISLLNYQVVYEEYFTIEEYGKLLDIIHDKKTNSVYAYTNKFIFRYKITNEHRNVWRLYTEKNEFELAKKYCLDNPAHMDLILCKQAELLFAQKQYINSAEIYSTTQTSFEEVCLKFLTTNQNNALMIYLRNRLNNLKLNDKTQITMLIIWMVELYLIEMSRRLQQNKQDELLELQKEFNQFMELPRVVDCMKKNRSIIYDLMASHGDNYNLTTLTTLNKDFEAVVNQYIQQENYVEALQTLKKQSRKDIFYKYCPILMEYIPHETVNTLINQGKYLDVIKLLPTLFCYDMSDLHLQEVLRYLECTVHSLGCIEQSIHNFLIKLYAEYSNSKLLTYLETQGKDISMIHYDVHYALRVCKDHKNLEACVFLQCLLELWQPAVELALTFNTKLAQQTASQPSDRDMKRKLWLIIAEHSISGKDDVKEALDLLKECDLLRIEDLLPFFSDFEKIDHFKEVICESLKEYNMKIQDQRKDMDESAKSAERVRNELQSFRNRSITVNAQEQCGDCGIYLLLKPFFVFPCGHKFHSDCLQKLIVPLLSKENSERLMLLKQQLSTANTAPSDSKNLPNGSLSNSNRDKIKDEIENILSSDCIYCGELMINQLNQPFIDDWDKVNDDWQ